LLRPGSGLFGIAHALKQAGVIRSSLLFAGFAEATGAARNMMAGEYDFPSQGSLARVVKTIRDGRVVRHAVTIPEGYTSRQVVQVLLAAPELSGSVTPPPEGSILPETYLVTRGERRMAVLTRMREARDRLLAKLWNRRRTGLAYQTPEQAVIVASMIEKETALSSERAHVAAVFLNRLAAGMRLESDPTVVYGLTGGLPLGHGLRVSELESASPYNTYRVAGLPPTPIDNPGRAALEAALDPAPNDDLYFVADGSGGHVFSRTLEAHLKNVAHWRALQEARSSAPAQSGQ
jgi:UPF0755 protein